MSLLKYAVLPLIILAFSSFSGFAQPGKDAAPDNGEMNQYVTTLLGKMTTEEKIGQLNLPSVGFDVTGPVLSKDVNEKIRKGLVGAVFNTFTPNGVRGLQDIALKETRLKIPLIFGYDVIHGHRTIFPIPLGLSCSWDTAMIANAAATFAKEATAEGLNWTFSPMVDIARDPRWGRVSEGAGEDTWLGCQIARAMVRGYQGDNTFGDTHKLMACVKHFALYGATEAGRDYNTVDMSLLKMYNDYLPPYKAAVDAGAGTVMTSFNEINGIPATGNKWLMTDVLRNQWGFKGFVVTDYTAINEMIQHGIGDEVEVARRALDAGVDMDMVGELFLEKLPQLVKAGKISMKQLDEACRRILEAKWKLGLFKDPYRYISEARFASDIYTPENLNAAKNAATQSMVLLKNDKQTLPLKKDAKVLFVGPFVNYTRDYIGNWSGAGDWKKCTAILDAVKSKTGSQNVSYIRGCNITDDDVLITRLNHDDARIIKDTSRTPEQMIDDAVAAAKDKDVIVAVLGESCLMSGEAACRTNLDLPGNQKKLVRALVATGKPVVLVLMNGRPLTLQYEADHVNSILETWFSGSMAGPAIADVLYGDANPSGKLTMTFPRNVGQIPIYYNHKNGGRPYDLNNKYTSKYLDIDNSPLYPFGYGLSYTSFSYSSVMQSAKQLSAKGGSIVFSVTVSNTGSHDGMETVEFYLRDKVGSVTRPVQQLAGAQKIFLRAGESRQVDFTITAQSLKFYNADLKYVNEPGAYEAMVGRSSADVQRMNFELAR